jgi:hypothetical protein
VTPRPLTRRRADAEARLATVPCDGWVATATAGPDGVPTAHLVPLSVAWIDERVVLAVELASRTARGIAAAGRARIGVGPTRDVVMIDAVLERSVPVAEAPAHLADGYAARSDWDPRDDPGGYAYLVLRPERIQAWREVDELAGRTLMRAGAWLVTAGDVP